VSCTLEYHTFRATNDLLGTWTGNCDDEGTLFSFANANLTYAGPFSRGLRVVDFLNYSNNDQVMNYFLNTFLPGASRPQVAGLLNLYPEDPSRGSPFDTGILNALTPQFKRMAAIQGDGTLQAPRRFFLNHTSGKQDIWVFR
jgi:cholinesterase